MKRMHVHVSVDDLQASIEFYSIIFASEPAVIKPDYAKWMLEDPRINFAISQHGAIPGLNHLGIQVESEAELAEMKTRLDALKAPPREETGTARCYAKSDKYRITDPVGIARETYHTLESIPVFGGDETRNSSCCVPTMMVSESKTPSSPDCC